MTSPFPGVVTPLTRVTATCETDTANPPATILWRQNLRLISREKEYNIKRNKLKITSAIVMHKDALYYATSTLSFEANLEQNGSTFDCVVILKEQQDLTSANSTLILKGRQYSRTISFSFDFKLFKQTSSNS